VNAVHALDSAAGLLVRYGGHAAAAGFSVPEERIPELEARLSDYVARTAPPEALIPLREAEIALPAHTLDPALASALARLAPFGRGNPEPVLVVTGVTVESPRVTENGHLFFRFGDRSATWWGGGAHLPALQRGPVDLLGTWGEETWQGRTRHRFLIEDARSARASSNGASP
jgi:single-stranded-DNA-specific exonuclease